jgi:glutamate racemase
MAESAMTHTAYVEALDATAPLNPNALRAARGPSLVHLRSGPIGVFDSGLGGLSVWRHLHARMPNEDFIYVADNANVPYGDKSEAWIRERMVVMTEWFLAQGCKAIVWACNTATAAGATYIRERYPDVFFVGLEPAIKPAVQLTQNKKIAMLATQRTVDSAKYQALVQRTIQVDSGVQLQSIACVGWAQAIDTGRVSGQMWTNLLAQYLEPVRVFGADVVVLGCTHYPFIADDIRAYLGEDVVLLDSGAPVARYTESILDIRGGRTMAKELGRMRNYATYVDEAVRAHWQYFSDVAHIELSVLNL